MSLEFGFKTSLRYSNATLTNTPHGNLMPSWRKSDPLMQTFMYYSHIIQQLCTTKRCMDISRIINHIEVLRQKGPILSSLCFTSFSRKSPKKSFKNHGSNAWITKGTAHKTTSTPGILPIGLKLYFTNWAVLVTFLLQTRSAGFFNRMKAV